MSPYFVSVSGVCGFWQGLLGDDFASFPFENKSWVLTLPLTVVSLHNTHTQVWYFWTYGSVLNTCCSWSQAHSAISPLHPTLWFHWWADPALTFDNPKALGVLSVTFQRNIGFPSYLEWKRMVIFGMGPGIGWSTGYMVSSCFPSFIR